MITSLIEMLELPNFDKRDHIYNIIKVKGKIVLVVSRTEIMMWKPLFQKAFILRKPRLVNFANVIKTATMFIKLFFSKTQKEKLEIMC